MSCGCEETRVGAAGVSATQELSQKSDSEQVSHVVNNGWCESCRICRVKPPSSKVPRAKIRRENARKARP